MAISDIMVRGFGNGTFDPGVNKLPTRGYTIGVTAVPSVPGAEAKLGTWRSHSKVASDRSHSKVASDRSHSKVTEE